MSSKRVRVFYAFSIGACFLCLVNMICFQGQHTNLHLPKYSSAADSRFKPYQRSSEEDMVPDKRRWSALKPPFSKTPSDQSPFSEKHGVGLVKSDRKIIILIAYMRSGSSMTGSILEELLPETFYVFEPIRALNRIMLNHNKRFENIVYLNGRERKCTDSELSNATFEEINNWLTCRLDLLSIRTLQQKQFKRTKVLGSFSRCASGPLHRKRRSVHAQLFSRNHHDIEFCLQPAIESCEKSKLLVIKFIRFKMSDVLTLMPFYPNMRVIHLVRDPRAIMNSRSNLRMEEDVDESEHRFCSRVEDDLIYSKIILQRYEGRLMLLRYEDLIDKPLDVARAIANFTELPFEEHLQVYINKITHAANDSCGMCVVRRNATDTAYKWRHLIDVKEANNVYDTCKTSNDILGYLPLNKTTLRDQRFPTKIKLNLSKRLLNKAFLKA